MLLLVRFRYLMNMDKNRSAIVTQILTELFHSGPAIGEAPTRLLPRQFLAGDEETLVFLFLEIDLSRARQGIA